MSEMWRRLAAAVEAEGHLKIGETRGVVWYGDQRGLRTFTIPTNPASPLYPDMIDGTVVMLRRQVEHGRSAERILAALDLPVDEEDDEEDEPKICVGCGMDTAPCKSGPWEPCPDDCDHTGKWEWYMLRDEVWTVIGNPAVLCVGCVQVRLGRLLTAADFADLPINKPHSSDSPRLAAARARQAAA